MRQNMCSIPFFVNQIKTFINVYIYSTYRWIKYAKVYCVNVGYGDGRNWWVER